MGFFALRSPLILLRRITLETPLSEALGKLIFEGVPFSLGVTLARSTLERRRSDQRRTLDSTASVLPAAAVSVRDALSDTLADIDATIIGAIVIAFSIAPTEEIAIIAAGLPSLWLLVIMAASLLISYIIVFASGFTDRRERAQRGLLLSPLTETLVAYNRSAHRLSAHVDFLSAAQQQRPLAGVARQYNRIGPARIRRWGRR